MRMHRSLSRRTPEAQAAPVLNSVRHPARKAPLNTPQSKHSKLLTNKLGSFRRICKVSPAQFLPRLTHSAPSTLIHWESVAPLYTREELVSQRERWRSEGKAVVFTNGCYDLLHPGHIRLLEQARSLGDVLILALNSDAGVRRFKGPGRPLVPENERAALAAALEAVDAVALFDEETPRELIAAVLPGILVKGADWSHFIAGREEVEASGGKVVAIPLEPGYSTTNIVERILLQP